MKKLWNQIKKIWRHILIEHDSGLPLFRLNQTNQGYIPYGSGVIFFGAVLLLFPIEHIQNRRLINTVTAYIASATDDEYDQISWQLRHDLVYSEFGQNIDNVVRYIPNTSDLCPVCSATDWAQAFLICTNTGEFYEMDVYVDVFQPDIHYGAVHMANGYDEISQTELSTTRTPDEKKTTIELRRKRGIVSIHKMKTLFCDKCIRNILITTENAPIVEFVIFDSKEKKFHPIDDEITVRIGDYQIVTTEIRGDYKITVTYMN